MNYNPQGSLFSGIPTVVKNLIIINVLVANKFSRLTIHAINPCLCTNPNVFFMILKNNCNRIAIQTGLIFFIINKICKDSGSRI